MWFQIQMSGKQTKILTVRTCLVVGGRNVTNNRLLCSSINIHNEEIYIHSVRSTKDRKQPWSIVMHVTSWLLVNIFKLRLKKIEGSMQSWIILESSATAFLIWTRGEPVQIRWRTNTKQKVPQCCPVCGEFSVVIAMAEDRRYIMIIICPLSDLVKKKSALKMR